MCAWRYAPSPEKEKYVNQLAGPVTRTAASLLVWQPDRRQQKARPCESQPGTSRGSADLVLAARRHPAARHAASPARRCLGEQGAGVIAQRSSLRRRAAPRQAGSVQERSRRGKLRARGAGLAQTCAFALWNWRQDAAAQAPSAFAHSAAWRLMWLRAGWSSGCGGLGGRAPYDTELCPGPQCSCCGIGCPGSCRAQLWQMCRLRRAC